MIKKKIETFEEYLQSVHAKDYAGTDDDMPDAFDGWLAGLQVDDLIAHADKWHDSMKRGHMTFKEFLRDHHYMLFPGAGEHDADGYQQWVETMDTAEMIELGEQYGITLQQR